MNAIFKRRSVRKFDLTKQVKEEDIDLIIRAGFAAPSARKQEPSSFIIIDDINVIKELATVSHGTLLLSDCNLVICVLGANPNTLITPHMEVQDLSACTTNMLNEATNLGLGSCWMGVYPLPERMSGVKEILHITEDHFPFSLIALGYPKETDALKDLGRYYPEKIHRNRY